MIFLFNKTVKNIIFTYISRETVTFDDRDHPCINTNGKQLVLDKNEIYKKYGKKSNDPRIFDK